MKHIFSKQNKVLLGELVRTDFKLRYQGSALGYTWSLLRPLLLFVILYFVFAKFLGTGSGIPHFPIYLLLGIVIWNFFNEMTVQSLGSIVGRGDLIRKIKIPRWIIVLSSSLSALINLFLNLVIVFVFMLLSDADFLKTGLFLPIILAQVYVLSLGLSLFLSAAFVKYRDIGYIWEVILQAGFYLTPILYSVALITNEKVLKVLFMNPMAQAIQDARYALVTHETVTISNIFHGGWYRLLPYGLTVVIFVVGVTYFRKESKHFAENI